MKQSCVFPCLLIFVEAFGASQAAGIKQKPDSQNESPALSKTAVSPARSFSAPKGDANQRAESGAQKAQGQTAQPKAEQASNSQPTSKPMSSVRSDSAKGQPARKPDVGPKAANPPLQPALRPSAPKFVQVEGILTEARCYFTSG